MSARILVLFDKHARAPYLSYTAVDIDQNITATGTTVDEALEILAKTLQVNQVVEPDPDPRDVVVFEDPSIGEFDGLEVVKRVSEYNKSPGEGVND